MAHSKMKHIYMPEDLQEKLKALSEQEDRSFSWMVRTLIQEAIDARQQRASASE